MTGVSGLPGDWITSTRTVGAAGQTVAIVPAACASLNSDFLSCLSRHGIRMAISYQPASRSWALQSLETAIYLVLAGGLGGFCYWRVPRPAGA